MYFLIIFYILCISLLIGFLIYKSKTIKNLPEEIIEDSIKQEDPDIGYYNSKFDELQTSIDSLNKHLESKQEELNTQICLVNSLDIQLKAALDRNAVVVSQKTSHAVRTGEILENVVPLLPNLPYNCKDLHHLGKPLDFIYFSYDKNEIVFVEVKSGNAKENPRQRQLKKIIKEGKVYYEKLTINEKGVNVVRMENK